MSTWAKPPSGHNNTSLASPLTERAPKQWPNSWSNTEKKRRPRTIAMSIQRPGVGLSLSQAVRRIKASATKGKSQ